MSTLNKLFIIAGAVMLAATLHASEKPNIIYILADDLGYGDLGCYGQKVIQTPHIDRMATEGMRFTQHYSGSTVCGPSRSSLLQGKHTGHTYVRGNGSLQMRQDPHDEIFPKALKQAGYHTALIGKSGMGCNTDDAALLNQKGFDYFFGYTSHMAAHWYFPKYLWRNDAGTVTKVEYPNNTQHKGDNYSSENVINEALQYIDQQKDGPFFLHLAFQIPHASLRAKEEWKAKYRPILNEKPLPEKKTQHYSYEREPKTTYAAMISYMDHNMGLLFAKLKEHGIAENTLVMFASDNGAMQEGGHKRASFQSSGILRGGKRDLYEGGVRTPMIAWWPGKIKAGSETDLISAFWDISPTLRELAQAEPQSDTDGISMLPTLLGTGVQKKHDNLYWEFFEYGGKRAIRQGKWKLILFKTNSERNPKIELYNLDDDISETKDLSAEFPEVVSELRKQMNLSHTRAEYKKFRFATEFTAEESSSSKKDVVANKPLEFSCAVTPEKGAPDGVLVVRGGTTEGAGVYVKSGLLCFSICRSGKKTIICSKSKVPEKPYAVKATLNKDGSMNLSLDGKSVATGSAGGVLGKNPGEPFSIGKDEATAAGDYNVPFAYKGKVTNVKFNGKARK
jgi:arylsulfatase A